MLNPKQVEELIQAAKPHYSRNLSYHNWHHVEVVMNSVTELIEKASRHGISLKKDVLLVAAAWHDAGFSEDHRKRGFPTKEHYSASLLEKYLEDKQVSKEDKDLMLAAILGTIHNAPRENLDILVLHRADISNIGESYSIFLKNNVSLWKEFEQLNSVAIPWDEYIQASVAYIEELPRLGEPTHTRSSFDTRAKDNVAKLQIESRTRITALAS